MKYSYLALFMTLMVIMSCRESVGDKPSATDIEMEKRIIGSWIYDHGEPPYPDSTILYFDFDKTMLIVDYSARDTIYDYRYKIRDSVLTLIDFRAYPYLSEIDYRINLLNALSLTIFRYEYNIFRYSKTYRKYQS